MLIIASSPNNTREIFYPQNNTIITLFLYLWHIKHHRHFYESINGGEPTCIDDDIPFDIPESWEWCRLEDFCLYGEAPSIKVNECTPETWVLDLEDIVAHAGRISKRITASERPSSSNKYSFERGSVLYSKLRPYLNKVIVAEEPGCCTTEIIPIRLFAGVSPYYLKNLLMSPFFVEEINNEAYGVKMPRADTKLVKSFLIPVPPIQEQLRIVGFLEAQNEKLNTLQLSRKRYKRVLMETPTSLRQQLIQAAIQGLLVPQNPNDEPASKLLERIAEERTAKLGKKVAKSMCRIERRGSKTYEIFPDGSEKDISGEIPFNIPLSWEWSRLGHICINRDSERVPLSCTQREKQQKLYDYYGASGVIDKVESYLFDSKLLLIGEDGANLINRSTDIAFFAEGKYWVNNHAHVLDSFEAMPLDFLRLYINSISLAPFVTGTAQPKLNQERLNAILVPVPPCCEQQRIVDLVLIYMRLIAL